MAPGTPARPGRCVEKRPSDPLCPFPLHAHTFPLGPRGRPEEAWDTGPQQPLGKMRQSGFLTSLEVSGLVQRLLGSPGIS